MVISWPQPLALPRSIRALSCVHVAPPWEQQLAAVLGGAMSPGALLVVGSPCALPSPSSRPPPTVILLVLEVVPESSVVIMGFCVVRRYRVVVAIMLPSCWSWVLISIAVVVSSVHPRSTARRAGGKCSALPCRVVISHCGWA